MALTKEAQEALISNYVKSGKNQDECIGFIDGVEAMNKLIGDKDKVEKAAPDLLESCQFAYALLHQDPNSQFANLVNNLRKSIEKATK